MTASTDFEDRRWRLAWAASTLPQAIDESGASALLELDRVWTELAHVAERSNTKRLKPGTVHGEDQGLAPSRRWASLLRSVQTRLDSFAARSATSEELEGLDRACARSLFTAATFLSLEVQELASSAVAPEGTLAEERRRSVLRVNDRLAQELLHHAVTRSWREFVDRYEAPAISSVRPLRPAAAPADSAPGSGTTGTANAEPHLSEPYAGSRTFSAAKFLRAAWSTSPLSSSLVTLQRACAAGSSWVASYEMVVILVPSLDERTVAPSLEVFLNVIRNDGGTVENVDVWGRRRLAYEIEKHAEGIYAVLDVRCEPKTIKEVDRQLALNESVLRTKVMRRDPTAAMDRGESGAS